VPAGYQAAVASFIKEENRHAALLAGMVTHLGGKVKRRHWSAWAFKRVRRLIPRLEFEVQILLSAELIACAYYGLLARHSPAGLIRRGCAALVKDEVSHISFHVDLFSERLSAWLPLGKALWRTQFQVLFLAAETLVWWEHGALFRDLGINRCAFVRQSRRACVSFLERLETPALRAGAAFQQPA